MWQLETNHWQRNVVSSLIFVGETSNVQSNPVGERLFRTQCLLGCASTASCRRESPAKYGCNKALLSIGVQEAIEALQFQLLRKIMLRLDGYQIVLGMKSHDFSTQNLSSFHPHKFHLRCPNWIQRIPLFAPLRNLPPPFQRPRFSQPTSGEGWVDFFQSSEASSLGQFLIVVKPPI